MKVLVILLLLAWPAAAYTLTAEEKAILGHVVLDPQAWAGHAERFVSPDAVVAKINKYRGPYEQTKKEQGDKYKSSLEICVAELGAKRC